MGEVTQEVRFPLRPFCNPPELQTPSSSTPKKSKLTTFLLLPSFPSFSSSQFADGGYYIKSLLDTTAREILNAEFKKQSDLESAKAEEKKVEVKEEDVKVVVSLLPSPVPPMHISLALSMSLDGMYAFFQEEKVQP